MKIENVELTNMRTFAQTEYKIPTGLSLVTGQNGTGKSTLLGIAAAWAMWGQTPGRSQDYLVRHGEREMLATVIFSSRGSRYSIRRRFRLNKDGKGGVTQLLFNAEKIPGDGTGGDLTGATVKETQSRINDIAGSFAVWQMTAYVGQREGAGQFLQANAYERKGILREIIAGVGDWDDWEALAKLEVKAHEDMILRIEGAIPILEQNAEPLDAVTQTLEASRNLHVEASSFAGRMEGNLDACNEALERGREVTQEWAQRDGAYSVEGEKLERAENQISVIEKNIADLKQSADQLDHINADYEARQVKISERQAEIDLIREANEILKVQDATNYAEYEVATENWRVERQDWQSKRDSRSTAIQDRVAALVKVRAADTALKAETAYCPECNQPLSEEHADELKMLIAANSGWEAELDSLKTEYEDLMLTQPPESPEAKPLNKIDEPPQALGQDENIIRLRTKAENATDLIQTQQIQLDELTAQRDAIGVKVTTMKRWFEAASRPEPDYLEKLLESARLATETARKSREAKSTAYNNILLGEQAVASAQQAADKLAGNRESLGDHRIELHEWEVVVQLTGTNGIRQLIIDQSLAQLEPACNRWLGIIAPGFEIAFSTQTDTDRETFDEGVIMPNGAIQPWSELSGAQSVAVALAVRLGLAEVGGSAQGIHYETLYLDEADAWLTGAYQQQFMDMLARVADTGIDVVAITHIEAVKEMVDQQVEVVANGDGSSRIK